MSRLDTKLTHSTAPTTAVTSRPAPIAGGAAGMPAPSAPAAGGASPVKVDNKKTPEKDAAFKFEVYSQQLITAISSVHKDKARRLANQPNSANSLAEFAAWLLMGRIFNHVDLTTNEGIIISDDFGDELKKFKQIQKAYSAERLELQHVFDTLLSTPDIAGLYNQAIVEWRNRSLMLARLAPPAPAVKNTLASIKVTVKFEDGMLQLVTSSKDQDHVISRLAKADYKEGKDYLLDASGVIYNGTAAFLLWDDGNTKALDKAIAKGLIQKKAVNFDKKDTTPDYTWNPGTVTAAPTAAAATLTTSAAAASLAAAPKPQAQDFSNILVEGEGNTIVITPLDSGAINEVIRALKQIGCVAGVDFTVLEEGGGKTFYLNSGLALKPGEANTSLGREKALEKGLITFDGPPERRKTKIKQSPSEIAQKAPVKYYEYSVQSYKWRSIGAPEQKTRPTTAAPGGPMASLFHSVSLSGSTMSAGGPDAKTAAGKEKKGVDNGTAAAAAAPAPAPQAHTVSANAAAAAADAAEPHAHTVMGQAKLKTPGQASAPRSSDVRGLQSKAKPAAPPSPVTVMPLAAFVAAGSTNSALTTTAAGDDHKKAPSGSASAAGKDATASPTGALIAAAIATAPAPTDATVGATQPAEASKGPIHEILVEEIFDGAAAPGTDGTTASPTAAPSPAAPDAKQSSNGNGKATGLTTQPAMFGGGAAAAAPAASELRPSEVLEKINADLIELARAKGLEHHEVTRLSRLGFTLRVLIKNGPNNANRELFRTYLQSKKASIVGVDEASGIHEGSSIFHLQNCDKLQKRLGLDDLVEISLAAKN